MEEGAACNIAYNVGTELPVTFNRWGTDFIKGDAVVEDEVLEVVVKGKKVQPIYAIVLDHVNPLVKVRGQVSRDKFYKDTDVLERRFASYLAGRDDERFLMDITGAEREVLIWSSPVNVVNRARNPEFPA